jgi:hypothetical protein
MVQYTQVRSCVGGGGGGGGGEGEGEGEGGGEGEVEEKGEGEDDDNDDDKVRFPLIISGNTHCIKRFRSLRHE